jgi:uncharacterized membrane protein YphA (DoxX/SURF4 family)
MPTLRIVAPLMLAWVFVREPLGLENRLQLVRLNASVQIAAAALLAIGKLPRLAAQQEIHFNKNLAMIGGLIVVVLQQSGRQRRGR